MCFFFRMFTLRFGTCMGFCRWPRSERYQFHWIWRTDRLDKCMQGVHWIKAIHHILWHFLNSPCNGARGSWIPCCWCNFCAHWGGCDHGNNSSKFVFFSLFHLAATMEHKKTAGLLEVIILRRVQMVCSLPKRGQPCAVQDTHYMQLQGTVILYPSSVDFQAPKDLNQSHEVGLSCSFRDANWLKKQRHF
jgi:hypothetical protein